MSAYEALADGLEASAADAPERMRRAYNRMTIAFGAQGRYFKEWTNGIARLQAMLEDG